MPAIGEPEIKDCRAGGCTLPGSHWHQRGGSVVHFASPQHEAMWYWSRRAARLRRRARRRQLRRMARESFRYRKGYRWVRWERYRRPACRVVGEIGSIVNVVFYDGHRRGTPPKPWRHRRPWLPALSRRERFARAFPHVSIYDYVKPVPYPTRAAARA